MPTKFWKIDCFATFLGKSVKLDKSGYSNTVREKSESEKVVGFLLSAKICGIFCALML